MIDPERAAGIGVAVAGLGVALGSAAALARRARESRWGSLSSIDVDASGATWRSARLRLVGRPDTVRRDRSGRRIPVELKWRPAPARGPFRSHLVQLWAYCLLLEEADGSPPPFGVVRYADREFVVPWDARARRELDDVRRAVAAPYDGRATPSPGRCAGCRWFAGCDARAG